MLYSITIENKDPMSS